MIARPLSTLLSLLFLSLVTGYDASWESLDKRPLPQWYPDAKVGIFLHWGVFSVPAFGNEWFWMQWEGYKRKDHTDFVKATEKLRFNYPDYAHRFDATLFDPQYWAETFAQAGAQYVVLTSKHHEGFCMWDSRNISSTWKWNAMEVGPRRDLLGEVAQAIRQPDIISPQTKRPLKFGIYHSLFEWFNPMYEQDAANNFSSSIFVDSKTMPELYHLVENYQPEVIWSDGDWTANSTYWKSTKFLSWLATHSPVKDTVVWNDRWGTETRCLHGSFWNCQDRYMPNTTSSHYFENAMTVDKSSWGHNRQTVSVGYMTTKELLDELVTTISRNGNLLVNVGPSADGTISPIMIERLLDMGKWLSVNGEGVYGTRAWHVCGDDQNHTVFYTRSDDTLYAHLTTWPAGGLVTLSCPEATTSTTGRILGLDNLGVAVERSPVRSRGSEGIKLQLPPLTPDIIPCDHVWVVALEGIGNLDGREDAASETSTA